MLRFVVLWSCLICVELCCVVSRRVGLRYVRGVVRYCVMVRVVMRVYILLCLFTYMRVLLCYAVLCCVVV